MADLTAASIEALAEYMSRAPERKLSGGGARAEAVWLKLDDEDAGGLTVQLVDAVSGRPFAYMHPDDFCQMAFGEPRMRAHGSE